MLHHIACLTSKAQICQIRVFLISERVDSRRKTMLMLRPDLKAMPRHGRSMRRMRHALGCLQATACIVPLAMRICKLHSETHSNLLSHGTHEDSDLKVASSQENQEVPPCSLFTNEMIIAISILSQSCKEAKRPYSKLIAVYATAPAGAFECLSISLVSAERLAPTICDTFCPPLMRISVGMAVI